MSDFRQLFTRCLDHEDQRAWSVFWSRERHWLRQVLMRTLRELGRQSYETELEDLEQEVYLRLLTRVSRGRLRIPCHAEPMVRAYLIRVAESVVIDHRRREGAAKRQGLNARFVRHDAVDVQAAAEVDPEAWTLLREHFERILHGCSAVAGKKAKRAKQHALALVLFGGYQSGEAARRTGGEISAGSIDAMVSRARSRLRTEGIELPRRRGAVAALPRAA